MSSETEWEEAFARWDRGESSLRDEAKRLGVDASTFLRRRLKNLESMIQLRRKELTDLEGAVAITKEKLGGLTEKYEKRRQEEEAKLRESLMKQERETRRRLEKIDAELRAKDAIISEFKRRGLDPTKGLQILKRHSDLDQALGQINREIEEKRGRANKLEEYTKSLVTGIGEKEGRWKDLTAKIRLARQLLQTRNTENQQLEEELSRKSTALSQLLNRIKELGDAKSKLNAEVRELGEERDTLEEQNADLKKALDAERVSLEEKNATLRKANSELEGMVKGYLQVIDEMKKAEKRREARVSTELKKRETEADREFERRKREVDENIRKCIEEGKTAVEEAVRKETAERMARSVEKLKTLERNCGRLSNKQEELRIQNIALGIQLGETLTAIELLKKKKKEFVRD